MSGLTVFFRRSFEQVGPRTRTKDQSSRIKDQGPRTKDQHTQQQKWCKETVCHLSQGTGYYLASRSLLCNAVLRRGHAALFSHDQLAKYHTVLWLRWHNGSWHQIFCDRAPIIFCRERVGLIHPPFGQGLRTAWVLPYYLFWQFCFLYMSNIHESCEMKRSGIYEMPHQ